ncbi:hypothetical protein AAFF_G00134830 [Aldrovandia affinis]|uniref:Uncharacterized protein n=1 Tax=Aldrovandia affinis TaxID=143900 RepID=A0AAD7RQ61_9TELE|nr:hypothetical protein AAFF_G00134830 [Aldrovandia affinis]
MGSCESPTTTTVWSRSSKSATRTTVWSRSSEARRKIRHRSDSKPEWSLLPAGQRPGSCSGRIGIYSAPRPASWSWPQLAADNTGVGLWYTTHVYLSITAGRLPAEVGREANRQSGFGTNPLLNMFDIDSVWGGDSVQT